MHCFHITLHITHNTLHYTYHITGLSHNTGDCTQLHCDVSPSPRESSPTQRITNWAIYKKWDPTLQNTINSAPAGKKKNKYEKKTYHHALPPPHVSTRLWHCQCSKCHTFQSFWYDEIARVCATCISSISNPQRTFNASDIITACYRPLKSSKPHFHQS